jgi:succinoglycan biosynthesis transport protein ExoP
MTMDPKASNPNVKLPAPATDSQHLSHSLLLAQARGDSSSSLPPGLSAAPTFDGLFHAFRRRWLLGLLIACGAAVTALAVVFIVMPPQYVATLRFQVAHRADQRVVSEAGHNDGNEFPLFKASQQGLIASQPVITRALKDKLPGGREVRDLEIVRSKGASAVDWLEKAIRSDFLAGPEFMRVTLGGDDPEEVAQLLNAVSRAYLDTIEDFAKQRRDEQVKELKVRHAQLEEDYRTLVQRLDRDLKDSPVKDRDSNIALQQQLMVQVSMAQSALNTLKTSRAALEADLAGYKARLQEVDGLPVPAKELQDALLSDTGGAALFKQLQQIATDISGTRTAANPAFAASQIRKLRVLEDSINTQLNRRRDEIRPAVEKFYREKVREETREAISIASGKLNSFIIQEEAQKKEVDAANDRFQGLEKQMRSKPTNIVLLEEQIATSKATKDAIAQKIEFFRFEEPRSRVTLLQEAAPPTSRDYSRMLKLGGGGAIMIFGLALFGVAFVEFRSRKISDSKEISHGLGLNVVGALPAVPLQLRHPTGASTDMQGGQVWTTQLNEAVDAVRTLLLHASRTEALRVVMVTSADSGEGKTTLASPLAASLSRSWRQTLLIDGDLRHPASHALFQLPPEPGLSEVLRNEVQVADAIRATPLSRLWVLPAGAWDDHAIQALAQDDVRTLIEELKQQYDFIVIDSPPVLPVADSLLLGQHVDGVLFSILRDVSRAPAVYAAQQKLQPLGIRILGAVMVGDNADVGRGRYRYLTQKAQS